MRHRGRARVHPVRARHDRQQRHQVLGPADQRAGGEHLRGSAGCRRIVPGVRDQPRRRFVAEHAAEEGRHADRAADVRADAERRGARTDRCALAARGPTGRPVGVVRIVRAPVHPVGGLDPQRQLRGVGDAKRDRAGVDQPLHRRRRLHRAKVAAHHQARGLRHALQCDRLLDGERHAEQRRQRLAWAGGRDSGVCCARFLAGLLEALGRERVDARCQELMALDVRLDHVARAHAAVADRGRELRSRALGQGAHVTQPTAASSRTARSARSGRASTASDRSAPSGPPPRPGRGSRAPSARRRDRREARCG